MPIPQVIAVDGHDGSGKTTLASGLARRLGGAYIRTFGDPWGENLYEAYRRRDDARVIDLGEAAIENALRNSQDGRVLVLDRSWMTVCSLVSVETFMSRWTLWVPTILCWSDLETTERRLRSRNSEPRENTEWHRHFLERYLECAARRSSPVLRTDSDDQELNLAKVEAIACCLLEKTS